MKEQPEVQTSPVDHHHCSPAFFLRSHSEVSRFLWKLRERCYCFSCSAPTGPGPQKARVFFVFFCECVPDPSSVCHPSIIPHPSFIHPFSSILHPFIMQISSFICLSSIQREMGSKTQMTSKKKSLQTKTPCELEDVCFIFSINTLTASLEPFQALTGFWNLFPLSLKQTLDRLCPLVAGRLPLDPPSPPTQHIHTHTHYHCPNQTIWHGSRRNVIYHHPLHPPSLCCGTGDRLQLINNQYRE